MHKSYMNKYCYIIPLRYWYQTRVTSMSGLAHYVWVQVMPLMIGTYFIFGRNFNVPQIISFFLFLLGMLCIYEFGYLVNDTFSLRREHKIGYNLHRPCGQKLSTSTWLMAIGSRGVMLVLTGYGVLLLHENVMLFLVFNASLLCIFQLHNLVLYPFRVFTFWALYFWRYLLPLFVVYAYGGFSLHDRGYFVFDYVYFALIYATSFAFVYANDKNIVSFHLLEQVNSVAFVLVSSSILLTLSCIIYPSGLWIVIVGLLSGWLFLTSAIKFLLAYGEAIVRSRVEVTHMHTYFSHDATLTTENYGDLLKCRGIKRVNITDHAEDFDLKIYRAMTHEFSMIPGVVTGLEYTINSQHVLAIGLDEYVDLEEFEVIKSIECLKMHSQRVILAHPVLAIRQLFNIDYIIRLLEMIRHVDGFEIFNSKNSGKRRSLDAFIISFLGIITSGRKMLYIGLDAHHPDDLKRIEN